MAVKRAKIIEADDLRRIFKAIESESNQKTRDKTAVLFSIKAGLRASEIAGLRWDDVIKANGQIDDMIHIGDHISKNGRAREIPMHPELKAMLIKLRKERPNDEYIRYGDYKPTMTANAMTVWFKRFYKDKVGLTGCSSHSGRRTAITTMARVANLHNASLRDVQLIAGHSNLSTTERYIEPSEGVRAMMASL